MSTPVHQQPGHSPPRRDLRKLVARFLQVARLTPFDTDTPEGRSLERYRIILITSASSLLVRGLGVAIGLIMVPLLMAYLGKERYGLWAAITTLTTWVALFDFGLARGLVNLVARDHGRDQPERAAQAVATAMAGLAVIAVLLGVAGLLAVPRVPWMRILGAEGVIEPETLTLSIAAALFVFLVTLPLSAVAQTYAGYQKTYVMNALSICGSVLGLGAVVLAMAMHATMPVLVLAAGSVGLIAPCLGLLWLPRALPWIRLRASNLSRRALGELTSRSLPMFLYQLGALAVNETQLLILANRANLSVVADYAVLSRLYLAVVGFIQLSTASFVPPFREAYERSDHDWTSRAFRRLLVLRMGLTAVGGGILWLAGNDIIRLWLGRSDTVFQWPVWAAALTLMSVTVWVTAFAELLWIMDRLWPLVGLALTNGAVTVVLAWILVPEHGVLGALVATCAVTLLLNTWVVPLLARHWLRAAGVR